jgi:glycosyltransferase involved in cell wall biosynthesis
MQSKVSMVIPCYNKVDYIAEMFDSIIAQKWDNIELILVNDGSTDGTREVIAAYEPKFRERGFGLLIVDQENKGVCAAAKAGLERVTGDYVCMVDCDDVLDPEYVNLPVRFLEENSDYDYTSSGYMSYTGTGSSKVLKQLWNEDLFADIDLPWFDSVIFFHHYAAPWHYMLRREYFDRCNIVETYHTATKGSHEIAYVIPVITVSERRKHFPQYLYYFNVNGLSHSRLATFEQQKKFQTDYIFLVKCALERLPESVATETKKRILFLANLYYYSQMAAISVHYKQEPDTHIYELLDFLCENGVVKDGIKSTSFPKENIWGFIEYLKCKVFGLTPFPSSAKKIIAFGVLGKVGTSVLPKLRGTIAEPNELWDKNGDGILVKKPDFASLTSDDVLFVLPKAKEVVEEIKLMTNDLNIGKVIFYGEDEWWRMWGYADFLRSYKEYLD